MKDLVTELVDLIQEVRQSLSREIWHNDKVRLEEIKVKLIELQKYLDI